jgi:hypothetical protein
MTEINPITSQQNRSKHKSQTIECPECGTEIEISEVLSSQLEKDLRKALQQENELKLKSAVSKAEQDALKKSALDLKDLENQLAEREKESLALRKQARELQAQQEGIEDEIAKRVKEFEKGLQLKLSDKIKADVAKEKEAELQDLQAQVDEKNKAIEKAREQELALRKQARELEDKQKELDITLQRKLDEGRKEIENKLAEKYHAESDLKLKEKEKQIESLRKSLEDAKRKSEQGSQETQGEALELDLEHKLRQQFSQDIIDTVNKGVRGADIIQTVSNNQMQICGKILWEAKNTKNWTQGWIQKLKDDQMACGANLSILVSTVLPEGVSSFAQIDGVWVCSVANALPLVSALREQLIQLNFARLSAEGKDEKMELMFQYITGDEFRQRIETIVSAFENMQMQIIRERRAMEKQWREREKQIDRIMVNTSGMHGDIKGIFGNSVREIKALELDDDVDYLEDGSD